MTEDTSSAAIARSAAYGILDAVQEVLIELTRQGLQPPRGAGDRLDLYLRQAVTAWTNETLPYCTREPR